MTSGSCMAWQILHIPLFFPLSCSGLGAVSSDSVFASPWAIIRCGGDWQSFGCGMLCSLVTAGMYWGLTGPGDRHLVWHSPLPGGMHASVAVAGTATQLGIGALALLLWRWAIGSGALRWPPLALSPGPDDGRICLQRLFPLLPNLGWFLIGPFWAERLTGREPV